MTDFLLELRCEEIPARMQAKASEDLARLFTERLAEAGLKAEKLTSYVTPRRLALIAHGLPAATEAVRVSRNIRVLSIAPLIGEAIGRTASEESVSSLFD